MEGRLSRNPADSSPRAPRRRLRPIALGLWALLAATGFGGAASAAHDVGPRPPGQFDYYVLSLSWAPGFCAINTKDPNECNKGLTFALHGLWPQLEGGSYPTNCSHVALSAADRATYSRLYASESLIDHEWPKHGTCSGLAPADYFKLSGADVKRVVLPSAYGPHTVLKAKDIRAVKAAFIAANPDLPAAGFTAVATRGVLTEVDICLTKAGAFRPC